VMEPRKIRNSILDILAPIFHLNVEQSFGLPGSKPWRRIQA
jgi:hypothetical protein